MLTFIYVIAACLLSFMSLLLHMYLITVRKWKKKTTFGGGGGGGNWEYEVGEQFVPRNLDSEGMMENLSNVSAMVNQSNQSIY